MIRVGMVSDFPLPAEVEARLDVEGSSAFAATPVVNLVEALGRRSDVHVSVIRTYKSSGRPEVHELSENVQLHLLPVPRISGMPVAYLPRVRLIRRYMKGLALDIAHGQGTEGGAAWMTSWLDLPQVVTVHGLLRLTHRVARPPLRSVENIGRWLETASLRRAPNVIAISRFVEEELAGACRNARFFAIPNAISAAFFREAVSKSPTPHAVCVGRISPEKGVLELMKALELLDRQGHEAKITLVGRASGSHGLAYEAACRASAEAMRHVDVRFVGWRSQSEVREILARATCVVLPSRVESFSMVLAESMALGTAPIAFANGAMPERIVHGHSGLLVAPGDIRALAEGLRRLLGDPELANRMGSAAREGARAWHPDKVAEQTQAAYRTILES